MKCLIPLFTAALLFPQTAQTQEAGAKRTIDIASEIFLRAASAHLKIPEKKLEIHSASSNPAEADLQTGELHAWNVWKINGPRVLNGFSSAGPEGGIAFDGYEGGIGHPGGIADLLKAYHLHDPKKPLSAREIARRVAYCLNDLTVAEIIFDPTVYETSGFTPPETVVPPALRPQKTGQLLTYFTMTPDNTGTWRLRKVSVTILPDFRTLIQREDL